MKDSELLYLSLGLARAAYSIYMLVKVSYYPKTLEDLAKRRKLVEILEYDALPKGVVYVFGGLVFAVLMLSMILAWPYWLLTSMRKKKETP